MIKNIKSNLLLNLKNIPGWRTNRKIIVFECDDWGSIRMPSKEVYSELLKQGYAVDKSRYTKYDTLADKSDLEQLFHVLKSATDSQGKPAVMTPVTNVANPDFEKIVASGFTSYFNEPFTATLERYNRHPETFTTWQKGISEGIFVPESHGSEHLSVQLWMKALQQGDRNVREAFKYGFASVDSPNTNTHASQFRPEFFFEDDSQIPFLKDSISDGVKLFNNIFGFIPLAFVPSNGIFHPAFEETLAKTGVKYLYVSHFMPTPDGKGVLKNKFYRTGKLNKNGLTYYTRNCAFEPTDNGYKGIELTLKQMEAAFRWKKPANISTHRVNFVGGIDEANREKGLKELKKLLNTIVKTWPDVEFMSTRDLFGSVVFKK